MAGDARRLRLGKFFAASAVFRFRRRGPNGEAVEAGSRLALVNGVGKSEGSVERFPKMWVASGLLLVVWFILKFLLHKGGYVHMLLLFAITLAVIQLLALRKTRYHTTGR